MSTPTPVSEPLRPPSPPHSSGSSSVTVADPDAPPTTHPNPKPVSQLPSLDLSSHANDPPSKELSDSPVSEPLPPLPQTPHSPSRPRARRLSHYEDRKPGDIEEVFGPGEVPPAEIEAEKHDPFLVDWEAPDDPANPKNWNVWFRWYLTMFVAVLTLNCSFASSAPSGIIPSLIDQFGMTDELATLTIAIFVIGYCVGPLLWGPLSESYGRRPIFLIAFTFYTSWQVGAALSPNTAAMLVFRFLGGTFAAAPLTNAGAVLADIWDADTRGKAMAMFTLAPFAGPALGPIVSGYMTVANVDWRWLFWLLAIFAGLCTVGIVFTLPETYTPVLLAKRAQQLRAKTGDDRYFAPLERAGASIRERLSNILGRPFKVLALEPMLIAITMYMSFVYGCIYLLFEAFPIVFTEGHGLNAGASGLMFLPLFLGGVVGVIVYVYCFNPRYERFMVQYDPLPVPPERRLEMAIIGGPLFAIAFFWFGWTSFPSVSYWAPVMSTLPLGFGITMIFLSLFNYIIDAYLMVAASAMASSTVVRSSFGAGFPLFATQMFEKLDARWASTLLGCIAVLMIPIPIVLMRYGHVLRRKSRYAPTD